MTTISNQDFGAAYYFNNTVVWNIIERCNVQPAPERGLLKAVAVGTGVVNQPAEGTLPTDSDFSATTTAFTPKLFVSVGNATELALMNEGLPVAVQQGLAEALKAAVEKEIMEDVLAGANDVAGNTDPANPKIHYATDGLTAVEGWLKMGNNQNRALMVMHPDIIQDVFKNVPERFHSSLFNFYDIPSLYSSELVPENVGIIFDPRKVLLVPYQEATITINDKTNPLKPVLVGRSVYGIHVQDPDSIYVFDHNNAPSA